jgi:hypothetical protein
MRIPIMGFRVLMRVERPVGAQGRRIGEVIAEGVGDPRNAGLTDHGWVVDHGVERNMILRGRYEILQLNEFELQTFALVEIPDEEKRD